MSEDFLSRPVSQGDLSMLRTEMSDRLGALERWIERCTTALESLIDEKRDVAVLTTQVAEQTRRLEVVEKRVKEVEDRETRQEIRFARYDVIWAIGATLGGSIGAALIRMLITHWAGVPV